MRVHEAGGGGGTVDALSDQTVVVPPIRQSGVDNLNSKLYRVDDFTGSIGGVAPGAAGYGLPRSPYHQTTTGATIDGPGYGQHPERS